MSTVRSAATGHVRAAAPRRRHRLPRPLLLVAVAAARDELDAALARGADPLGGPLLALRAAQLERPRHRRAIARSLRRAVAEATSARPPARAAAAPTIARGQVLDDARDVLALALRLECPWPADAPGIAIAQRLLTDAFASPLYACCEPHTLARLARRAQAEMGPCD
jgi:hypothetical protein